MKTLKEKIDNLTKELEKLEFSNKKDFNTAKRMHDIRIVLHILKLQIYYTQEVFVKDDVFYFLILITCIIMLITGIRMRNVFKDRKEFNNVRYNRQER